MPTFTGVVDAKGALHLDATAVFKAYLSKLANAPIELIVRRKRQKRTLKANSYWWGVVIPEIADSLGHLEHEHEAVHDAVVRHIAGLKPDCDPRLQIRVSTADMDMDDFGVLIEATVIWAATELGIVVPDPEKCWHMKPARVAA